MKNKNIFLHIGLPKTGTTSIQSTLQHMQNSGFLKENNFQYHNHHNLFVMQLEKMCFPNDEEYFLKRIHNELRIYTMDDEEPLKDNIILSQETFLLDFMEGKQVLSSNSAKIFHKAFKDYSVKIIIYLRRQDTFLESLYAQWAKSGRLTRSMVKEKYLQKSLFYKKHLDEYAKFFGKENIIVRIFEKEFLLNGDVVADFFHLVGLGDVPYPNIQSSEKNLSLSPEALRIRLAFDEKFRLSSTEQQKYLDELEQDYMCGKLDRSFFSARKVRALQNQNVEIATKYDILHQFFCFEKTGNFSNSGFMCPEERRDFLAQYEEDNAAVARKYLRREDGKLFNDNFPENIISLEEPSTTDIVATFLPIMYHLHERTLRAENKIETLLGYIKTPWKVIPVIVRKLVKKLN